MLKINFFLVYSFEIYSLPCKNFSYFRIPKNAKISYTLNIIVSLLAKVVAAHMNYSKIAAVSALKNQPEALYWVSML